MEKQAKKNNVDYPRQGKQMHIERVTPLLIASLLLVVTDSIQADNKLQGGNACSELLKFCRACTK